MSLRKDFTYAEKILALNGPIMVFFIYVALMLVNYLGARVVVSSGATELTTGEFSSLMTYGMQILASRQICLKLVPSICILCISTLISKDSKLRLLSNFYVEVGRTC